MTMKMNYHKILAMTAMAAVILVASCTKPDVPEEDDKPGVENPEVPQEPEEEPVVDPKAPVLKIHALTPTRACIRVD